MVCRAWGWDGCAVCSHCSPDFTWDGCLAKAGLVLTVLRYGSIQLHFWLSVGEGRTSRMKMGRPRSCDSERLPIAVFASS